MTILVVVRDADVRVLVKEMLKRPDWHVLEASSASAAVAAAASADVDVLIAEVAPTVDGRALAETLRRRAPDLAVVYVTRWYDAGEPERATTVLEPFTRDELTAAVTAAVFERGS